MKQTLSKVLGESLGIDVLSPSFVCFDFIGYFMFFVFLVSSVGSFGFWFLAQLWRVAFVPFVSL